MISRHRTAEFVNRVFEREQERRKRFGEERTTTGGVGCAERTGASCGSSTICRGMSSGLSRRGRPRDVGEGHFPWKIVDSPAQIGRLFPVMDLHSATNLRSKGSFLRNCAEGLFQRTTKNVNVSNLVHPGIVFLLIQFLALPSRSIAQDVALNTLVVSNLSSKTPLEVRIISDSKDGPGLLQPDGLRVVTERIPVSGKVTFQIPNGEYSIVAGITEDSPSLSLKPSEQVKLDFGPKGVEVKSTLHFLHMMGKELYQATGNGNGTLINRTDGTSVGVMSYLNISESLIFSFTQNATEWTFKKVTLAGFREFENNAGKKLIGKVIAVSDNKEEAQIQLESGELRVIQIGTLSLKDQNYLQNLPQTQYMAVERTDGRTVYARIVAVKKESVQIQLADDSNFEIPLSQLSPTSIQRIHSSQAAGQTPPAVRIGQ